MKKSATKKKKKGTVTKHRVRRKTIDKPSGGDDDEEKDKHKCTIKMSLANALQYYRQAKAAEDAAIAAQEQATEIALDGNADAAAIEAAMDAAIVAMDALEDNIDWQNVLAFKRELERRVIEMTKCMK